jgi:hypothetical protein
MSRLGQMWDDAQPCGTDAGYQRHRRRGERSCYPCLQAQARRQGRACPAVPDPRPVRNGLPEPRPYVYRGLGCDAFTGEVVL